MTQANDSPSPQDGGDDNSEQFQEVDAADIPKNRYIGRIALGEYENYTTDIDSSVSRLPVSSEPEVYGEERLKTFNDAVADVAYLEYLEDQVGLGEGEDVQNIHLREWIAYWNEQDESQVSYEELRNNWPWLLEQLDYDSLGTLRTAEEALRIESGDPRACLSLTDLPDDELRTIESLRARDEGELVVVDVLVDTRSKKDDECYCVVGVCDNHNCNEQTIVWQDRFASSVDEPEECNNHSAQTATTDIERLYYTKQELLLKDLPSRVGHTNTEQVTAEVNTNHIHEFEAGERVRIAAVVRRDTSDGEKRAQHYLQIVGHDRDEERFDEVDVSDRERQRIEELSNEDDIVDRLAESVAPDIKGGEEYTLARRALLHQLAGANLRPPLDETNLDDQDIRGTIHIAFAGDPSTGKTRLARRVNAIFPNSRYVDMESASAVGLKGSVQRVEQFDTNRWTVSTGALASANRGIVVADELDKAHADDAKALHGPMSDGIVRIDKANIHTDLEARTSILAVCNPEKQRFDKNSDLKEQIPIPDALWSRFDVVVPFEDDPLDDVANRQKASRFKDRVSNNKGPEFTEEFVRKYIAVAREYDPELTESAAEHLEDIWVELRQESSQDTVSVTTRHQDAMYRLAQASARLRLSDEVEVQDVRRGKDIVETSLRMISEDDELDADLLTAGPSADQREMIEVAEELVEEALSLAPSNAVDEEQIWTVAKNQLGDEWTQPKVVESLDLAVQNGVLWRNQAGYGVVDNG
ncbi:ATP-binding protein [Halorientalis pallida]|uniref:ATP-binding protein n=1 Tax=Halorientalis pallida TaxID=2479928 RepID=UPI003C70529A